MGIEKTKKECAVMEFRIEKDTVTGKPMVEVWQDDKFIAAIYTHEDGV